AQKLDKWIRVGGIDFLGLRETRESRRPEERREHCGLPRRKTRRPDARRDLGWGEPGLRREDVRVQERERLLLLRFRYDAVHVRALIGALEVDVHAADLCRDVTHVP